MKEYKIREQAKFCEYFKIKSDYSVSLIGNRNLLYFLFRIPPLSVSILLAHCRSSIDEEVSFRVPPGNNAHPEFNQTPA